MVLREGREKDGSLAQRVRGDKTATLERGKKEYSTALR